MSLTPKHRIVGCPLAERGQNLHLGYDAKNKDKICYPARCGIVIRSLSCAERSLARRAHAEPPPDGRRCSQGCDGRRRVHGLPRRGQHDGGQVLALGLLHRLRLHRPRRMYNAGFDVMRF